MFDRWPEVSNCRAQAWLKKERLPRKMAFVSEKPMDNITGQMTDASARLCSRHG